MARRGDKKRDRGRYSEENRSGAQGKSPSPNAFTSGNINLRDEGTNIYAESVESGHRIDPRAQKIFIVCIVLIVMYVVALIIPKDMINESVIHTGYNTGYTFSWFVEDLQENINGILAVITGNADQVRYLPIMLRYIVIALTGAGLALCGAIYQGSFRNALVSPSSMGVMSGASAGMILWVLFYVNDECTNVPWISNVTDLSSLITSESDPLEYLWSSYSLCIFSFIGCAIVAGLVLVTMAVSKKNSTSGLMIIITGQVFGGILGSFSSAVRYYMTEVEGFESKLLLLNATQIGSFYRDYTVIDILAVLIPVIICVVIVFRLNQRMMVLSFGNEEARSLGVDSKRVQILVVSVSTLLTAILVSFCGRIGFVGFLVPHLARRMVGPNFRYLLPASMAIGALFVLTAYMIVSATLGPDYETMVGMFISIGGAAIFLVQALRGARGGMGGGGMGGGFTR